MSLASQLDVGAKGAEAATASLNSWQHGSGGEQWDMDHSARELSPRMFHSVLFHFCDILEKTECE